MRRKKVFSWTLIGFVVVVLVTALVGCAGSVGPAGPEGPQGPPGPTGPPGESADGDPDVEEPSVQVDAGSDKTVEPGETVSLTATVTINDGSTVQSYAWQKISGIAASLDGASSATLEVTLAGIETYRASLVEHLNPVDRFQVLGIDPFALEEAESSTYKVTVTTSSGTYSDTVSLVAHLPYVVSTGIANVPIGLPVLLHGKEQNGYNWTLTGPNGSSVSLDSPASQNPSFIPDVTGQYVLTESNSNSTISVFAGTYIGAISGQDSNGRPLSENCTVCHNGTIANMGTIATDNFTPWSQSGHADIFSVQLNTSTHYGESCLPCHTVGLNTEVDNNGIDDASDWEAFLATGMIHNAQPTNWAMTLENFPVTASRANIQCENCHGPNTGNILHSNGIIDEARVSIASEVCGSCHGEPARHGRYQQWEESQHANYELAIDRGTSTSCARCHAGQGFLAWLPQLEAGNSGSLASSAITWTADTVEPVTCAVCHDSHNVGTTSGEPNDVVLRVSGDTAMLPAGFQATAVGNGALCMTCHNTRNGAHNDSVAGIIDDRAPHTAAQADVLMGENAYFVDVGARAAHSYIEDSCTKCHMVLTPPPAEFSYNLGGTNHSFEASTEICADCHGAYDGGSLTEAIAHKLEELKETIEEAIITEITAQTDAGNVVVLVGLGANGTDVKITDGNDIEHLELLESHGRSAMEITINGVVYDARLASDTKLTTAAGTDLKANLLSSAQGQNIAKACWNFFLIEGDGSHGIHNPDFTLEVLNAAIAALK